MSPENAATLEARVAAHCERVQREMRERGIVDGVEP